MTKIHVSDNRDGQTFSCGVAVDKRSSSQAESAQSNVNYRQQIISQCSMSLISLMAFDVYDLLINQWREIVKSVEGTEVQEEGNSTENNYVIVLHINTYR